MKIPAFILFDLDETLIYEEKSVQGALMAAGAMPLAAAHAIDPARLAAMVRECAREQWRRFPTWEWCMKVGVSSWEGMSAAFGGDGEELAWLREHAPDYRQTVWRTALGRLGVRDETLVKALLERYPREREARHVPYPETRDVLAALRAGGCRMGVLTNGLSDHQREKLARSGLEEFFAAVTVSGDRGIGKPDPRVFTAALEALAAPAAETWMVGDSLVNDVGGGRAAGLRTVWVNRTGKPGVAEAELTVTSLRDLL